MKKTALALLSIVFVAVVFACEENETEPLAINPITTRLEVNNDLWDDLATSDSAGEQFLFKEVNVTGQNISIEFTKLNSVGNHFRIIMNDSQTTEKRIFFLLDNREGSPVDSTATSASKLEFSLSTLPTGTYNVTAYNAFNRQDSLVWNYNR